MSSVTTSESADTISTDELVRSLRAALNVKPSIATQAKLAQQAPIKGSLQPIAQKAKTSSGSKRYMLAFLLATVVGMGAVWQGNQTYAPEMYGNGGMVAAADAHALNQNYAVFDLNLNIRALRAEQLKRMTKTPDVILLGASHWQEAHKNLMKEYDFFNAHIHRDYWEDLLGMAELLVKNNRLPKKLIISIRDNQFKPVELRKDFLWEPGIPAYRDMSKRLGLKTQSLVKTLPYDRGRALLSLPMLFENLTRWYNASERPGVSTESHFETLDTLLPDGSITWSNQRMQLFTPERTKAESDAFAQQRRNDPPVFDQQGINAFNTLLTFLKEKGVSVYLVKPPFNPTYYDQLQGTPYSEGLKKVEELIDTIAATHKLSVFGSFNPHDVGCTSAMYIDAEHSNEKCLKNVFDQFIAIDAANGDL